MKKTKFNKHLCVRCQAPCLNTFANGFCVDCEQERIDMFAPLWAPTESKTWIPERRETTVSAVI